MNIRQFLDLDHQARQTLQAPYDSNNTNQTEAENVSSWHYSENHVDPEQTSDRAYRLYYTTRKTLMRKTRDPVVPEDE